MRSGQRQDRLDLDREIGMEQARHADQGARRRRIPVVRLQPLAQRVDASEIRDEERDLDQRSQVAPSSAATAAMRARVASACTAMSPFCAGVP